MTDRAAPYSTRYDHASLAPGIVHLGYGAFHRAHQAVYIDDAIEATGARQWGIAAVNLRAADRAAFADAACARNGYLVKSIAPDGAIGLRLVRSHVSFTDWSADPKSAEGLLALNSVHAVTITVTESGYSLNTDWSLNTDDPVIAAEIKGGTPRSVYGYLARGLDARRAANGAPITIMCCDNIRANGKMLNRNFLRYLEVTGQEALSDWVRANASFPCSMVDRITPRATPELETEIAQLFPGQRLMPVHAEAFSQWVLEDSFAGPMPDLAAAGVEIVDNVDPYEEAKIRILNGGHTGLTYLGALAGHQTFDEAMADPSIRPHFDAFEREEVLAGLTIDLPFDRSAYLTQIAHRFENQAIADQLERICMDGWSKMPVFIRPTLASCLKQGITPRHGYDCVASWVIYARRFAAGTMPVRYHEPYWETLKPLLAEGQEEALARTHALWADLPDAHPGFVPGLVNAIEEMDRTWPG